MRLISFIIPAHNENKNILTILAAIVVEMEKVPELYTIILVDDGSTDDTWQTILHAHDLYPMVQAIRLSRNFGKEAALAAGLDLAQGDAVIILDADMQHPPSLIPEMIRLWNAGNVDVVEAFKRIRGNESFIYKACSKFLYFILNRIAAMDLDSTSDFCLLDSKVVAAWRQLRETNLFFRGLSAWLGFRRVQLFFDVPARVNGSSRWTVLRLVRLATTSITAFTSLPLHVITLMGGIFFVFALVMGTRAVFLKFYSNTVIDGITTLILLNLLVGSLLMIALGVIGEYIARIYSEVKFRPRYIIADQFVERKSECFRSK